MYDSMWECECGNIQYGKVIPTECDQCFKIDGFTQLPEELMEEREKERIELNETDFKKAQKPKKAIKSKKRSKK